MAWNVSCATVDGVALAAFILTTLALGSYDPDAVLPVASLYSFSVSYTTNCTSGAIFESALTALSTCSLRFGVANISESFSTSALISSSNTISSGSRPIFCSANLISAYASSTFFLASSSNLLLVATSVSASACSLRALASSLLTKAASLTPEKLTQEF